MKDAKIAALDSVDSIKETYSYIADYIWENPELSLKEFKATELYTEYLEKFGFSVERNICGIETAFSGTFGSGRPVIGILGEYDALSCVNNGEDGHGCGHNLLGAASFAAAVAVRNYLENTGKEGTVIFYGCPGEEGGSGKAFMARDGIWKSLDAALTWHPSDISEVRSGTNNSSIQVLYRFKGLSAHAASNPECGRSALDAVELMNIGVQFLREHMTDDCRVHYSILDTGGVSPNVVQSEASVLYMTRANKVRDCIALQKRVDKIAEGAALMTETEYERVFIDGTAELLPNFTLEKVLYSNFREFEPGIGLPASNNEFHAGSTDVGDVSWLTPTAQIYVASWPEGTVPHTPEAVSLSKTEKAYDSVNTAAKSIAGAVIDLIDNPEILEEAKAEFAVKAAGGYNCPIEEGAVPRTI